MVMALRLRRVVYPSQLGRPAAGGRAGHGGRGGHQRRAGGQGLRPGAPGARQAVPLGRAPVRGPHAQRPDLCQAPGVHADGPGAGPGGGSWHSAAGWRWRATSRSARCWPSRPTCSSWWRRSARWPACWSWPRPPGRRPSASSSCWTRRPTWSRRPAPGRSSDVRGEVVFDDVSFGYLRSEPVLDGFSLRVAPGEVVALVGASGSGKSTVSLLLPRFYDPQSGRITLDGVDVRDLRLASLRSQLGVVFEESFLFSETIRENLSYGRPDASEADIVRAAQWAQADRFIQALPDGYDTVVGERGLTLSGGQRQRIALARALLTDPHVLLLDDATSSIDVRTEEEIHDTLRRVMRGPDDDPGRAPALDPEPGRSHRRARRRPRGRQRHPRRAGRAMPALSPAAGRSRGRPRHLGRRRRRAQACPHGRRGRRRERGRRPHPGGRRRHRLGLAAPGRRRRHRPGAAPGVPGRPPGRHGRTGCRRHGGGDGRGHGVRPDGRAADAGAAGPDRGPAADRRRPGGRPGRGVAAGARAHVPPGPPAPAPPARLGRRSRRRQRARRPGGPVPGQRRRRQGRPRRRPRLADGRQRVVPDQRRPHHRPHVRVDGGQQPPGPGAAARAAHPGLRPPPAAGARLLRPRDDGPDPDPHDLRHRGAPVAAPERVHRRPRPAGHVRGRHRGPDLDERRAGSGGAGHRAAARDIDGAVPSPVGQGLRRGPRPDRRGQRQSGREHLRRPGGPGLRP